MTDAALFVALANARALRRPTHARAASVHDALADPSSATQLLGPFLGNPLRARELPVLHALHRAVISLADALIAGSPPPVDAINDLAAREPAVYVLTPHAEGRLRAALQPRAESVLGALLIQLMQELEELDPSRLRRCARRECGLLFYDTTRSATRRWHSEQPCGLRERQRRHRASRAV
ncbi:MAG: CGNR zinc finger domain-containing protein [Solirubrobacteraceae bacterium]